MTDKLVKWLRRELPMGDDCIAPNKVCVAGDCPCDDANILAAADRIEALEKRNNELEAALRNCCDKWENGNGICEWLEAVDEARSALGEKKDG